MHAIGEIVRIHDGADLSFLYGCFEYGQIYLSHRALVYDRIRVVTVKLRIVSHVVFDGGADALALHALDVSDCDARGEKWIFTEVFEVPAIHW